MPSSDAPPPAVPTALVVRTEPVQQRSSARIALLLDAAAELIDESGIDGVTTSAVAARSDSSIGVVYRYFPNMQSLLRALAARNMELYTDQVFVTLAADTGWTDIVNNTIDAYVELYRTVPGFRALRFGDVIAERFLDPELSNNSVLAHAFAGLLGERYNFEPDEKIVFELEITVEIVDAILKRAFLLDRDGDERFIEKSRQIARSYLEEHTILPSES